MIKYFRTKRFLQEVAKHISSYTQYSKTEYVCDINSENIWILPDLYVFPNRYSRKESDRQPVVLHVLFHHFSDCLQSNPVTEDWSCNTSKFQQGRYLYKLSSDKKKRKWIRIA